MKIEKIIVSELPQNCFECQFSRLVEDEEFCNFECPILRERINNEKLLDGCPLSDKSESGARVL